MKQGDANTKICGLGNFECVKKAWHTIVSQYGNVFRKMCNCLPACTNIQYKIKTDRGKLNRMKTNEKDCEQQKNGSG